jgi:ribonuclease D
MPVPEHQTFYIDDSAAYLAAVSTLKGFDAIYLDLEADSLHHYHAKICLLQVHVGHQVFLIDPLAGLDLAPLLQVLAQKRIVFHGGDYDLRMLFQEHGFKPREIFDTMVAAQLLGFTAFG